jgi:SAM-dependent methyltransferase
MARGPLAAGGGYYEADLIVDALDHVGGSLADVERALDFGCSSGRVVRVLAAAHPEIEWHGVDPNERAIEWARAHLAGVRFAASPIDPPLPFPDRHFDLVYAISIWSHFGEEAALRWLEEMRRVIVPGGHLIFTTHSLQSLAFYGAQGLRTPRQLEQIRQALYRSGFWFAPEFGEEGDFGVKHPEWGTSFISPEWLARQLTPQWRLEHYAVGRNAGNQDVVLLSRR